MMLGVKIPIGIEDFEKIRTENYYYIDKTKFIADILKRGFLINLITRPRRFGKTLMMSMLKYFFDIRKDSKKLFEGLEIAQYEDICAKWMNQCPTIFISLKDATSSMGFEEAYEMLRYMIAEICREHSYLLDCERIDDDNKREFMKLKANKASQSEIKTSFLLLSKMMHTYYGKKVVILIDEYDVPLAKANEYGYYKEMLDVIRGIMSISLKTNEHLEFAIVTGCLRIAKESIFTGTNHFANNSIENGRYMDAFGFTEEEVQTLLKDMELEEHFEEMKQWYDGYHFGKYDMYCPWDVINHVAVLMDEDALSKKPRNYWKDTSHNNIIRKFIGNPNIQVNEKFETLLSGGSVEVQIKDDLTYDFEHSSEDNLWSILYLTGYLTRERKEDEKFTYLMIPNEEIKTIFADTIVEWFKDTMQEQNRDELFQAWWNGDCNKLTEMISEILFDTISYFDYREDYYHAFLAGMFTGAGYSISSNDEMGLGRADIVIKDRKNRRAIIIETKYSESEMQLANDCDKAIKQMQVLQYVRGIPKGYRKILCYGVAFYDKFCMVKLDY